MSGEYLLAYLNPAFALSCALLLWFLERRWPAHRYLFPLGLGFIYLALGFISQDFFGFSSSDAVNYAGNGLFYGAVLLACSSTVVRAGIRVPFLGYALVTALILVPFLWFSLGNPLREARIYVLGVGFAAIAATTLSVLLKAPPRNLADRLVISAVSMAVGMALLRPLLVLAGILDVGPRLGFSDSEYWATIRVFTPLVALGIIGVFLFAMALDIHAELKRQAEQDFLSRLLNRRGFEGAVAGALERNPKQSAALLLADIDNFKVINDSFGHKTGDEVIATIAKVLSTSGEALLAGRVGGEEFALFYQGNSQASLRRHADSIRNAITKARVPGLPAGHPLTLSIGIHMQREDETLAEMLIEADRALYRAKAAGKDRAVMTPARLRTV
jgi:diguanylate cyclase (GGDEF)-like protein